MRFWIISYRLCLLTVVLQAVFGDIFYKISVGPLYVTEFIIILAWLLVVPSILLTLKLPWTHWHSALFSLSLFYFIYSFSAGRDFVWVARQSAFILYMSTSVISFKVMKYNLAHNNEKALPNKILYICLLIIILQGLSQKLPASTYYTSTLLLLIFYSKWLLIDKRILIILLKGVMASIFLALCTPHTAFAITPLFVMMLFLFCNFKSLRVVILLGSVLLACISLYVIPGILDYNAIWRFIYWASIVQESWRDGWFLVGKGFGVQYMPESSDAFDLLIAQVSSHDNAQYQLMTVPPHNSLLTILIYLGLPGIILFLYPIYLAFKLVLNKRFSVAGQEVFFTIFGMLILLCSNQFLEVPYAALIFWMTYGVLIAFLRKSMNENIAIA